VKRSNILPWVKEQGITLIAIKEKESEEGETYLSELIVSKILILKIHSMGGKI